MSMTALPDEIILSTKNFLLRHHLANSKMMVAVSGGVDSVVLLDVLVKLQKQFRLSLRVAHICHAPQNDIALFHQKSFLTVKNICHNNSLEIISNFESGPCYAESLKSESAWRKFRFELFKKWLEPKEYLVLGHHRDDLLETRILRLIRGVGAGGLKAMRAHSQTKLRPFLNLNRSQIESYAKKYKIEFVEDPSNENPKILRNWLRHNWLPQLESRQPGAKKSLSRSLTILSNDLQKTTQNLLASSMQENMLIRSKWLGLNHQAKIQLLALYLQHLEVQNYTQSHLEEILKRLDTRQKVLKFKVIGCVWGIDAQFIFAQKQS